MRVGKSVLLSASFQPSCFWPACQMPGPKPHSWFYRLALLPTRWHLCQPTSSFAAQSSRDGPTNRVGVRVNKKWAAGRAKGTHKGAYHLWFALVLVLCVQSLSILDQWLLAISPRFPDGYDLLNGALCLVWSSHWSVVPETLPRKGPSFKFLYPAIPVPFIPIRLLRQKRCAMIRKLRVGSNVPGWFLNRVGLTA